MSILVMPIGPVEYWWNTPDDPNRFNSPAAVEYRGWRDTVSDVLVSQGFLVYRHWQAFKGAWDERAQPINDWVIEKADVIVNMSPAGIPGRGTAGEMVLAIKLGKPVIFAPPGTKVEDLLQWIDTALKTVVN